MSSSPPPGPGPSHESPKPGGLLRDIPLRHLLLLGILFCGLVPLLVVSLISFNASRAELKTQAFRQLQSVRDIKITLLQKFYFERRADVRVFAANPYVLQAYRDFAAAARARGGEPVASVETARKAARERYSPFLKSLIREYEYHDLFLLDPGDGTIVFSSRGLESPAPEKSPGLSPALAAAWSAARAGALGVSDLVDGPASGVSTVQFLAAPILDGGKTAGIVAVQIAPDAVPSIFRERSGMGRTGLTFLVGGGGRILAAPGPARPAQAPADIAGAAAAGTAGDRVGAGLNGSKALTSFAPAGIPGVDWTMFAEIDEREIDEQISRALDLKIGLLIAASFVLLAALAMWIARALGRGVHGVLEEIRRLIRDVLAGRLGSRGKTDAAAADFRPVLAQINTLIEAFERQGEESRRLQEHLRDAQRLDAIGTLAAGIAHDFNNILAHMHALAYIAEEELRAAGRDPLRMEEMKRAIERGTGLVQQILTFSRPGRSPLAIVDLRENVAETVELLRAAAPSDIGIDFEAKGGRLLVCADPSQIQQIVMNLGINGLQAMRGAGGRLDIRLGEVGEEEARAEGLRTDRYVRLSVEDNGPGMPPEIKTKIFEPFFTTKPAGQGTGLGLSVVAGIVMSLGGEVRVESAEGRGSRFDVFLPRSE